MSKKILTQCVALLLVLIHTVSAFATEFEMGKYTGNNVVSISGVGSENSAVTVIIKDNDGGVIWCDQVRTNSAGVFDINFVTDENPEDCNVIFREGDNLFNGKLIMSYTSMMDSVKPKMFITFNGTETEMKISVHNNYNIENYVLTPAIAIYDSEGRFIQFAKGDAITVPNGETAMSTAKLKISDDAAYAKAFALWGDTIIPLAECEIRYLAQESTVTDLGLPDTLDDISADGVWECFTVRKESTPIANVLDNIDTESSNEIFVSKYGNDENDGSFANPVNTVAKAVELANNDLNIDTIYLFEGDYVVNKEISLNRSNITFSAFKDDKVTLSSVIKLDYSKFKGDIVKSASFADLGIFDSDVKIGTATRPVLIFDGEVMNFSRYPKNGYLNSEITYTDRYTEADGYVDNTVYYHEFFSGKIDKGFTYIENDIPDWSNKNNIWVTGWFASDCQKNSIALKSITGNSVATKYSTTFFGKMTTAQQTKPNRYYWNIVDEVTLPGEFAIDTVNDMIYLYPHTDSDTAELYLLQGAKGDENIWLAGESKKENFFNLNNCNNVVFNGINFKNSRDRAITITNSSNVRVQNCEFENIYAGIKISDSSDCGVINSKFFRIAEGDGVRIEDSQGGIQPKRNYVQNCLGSGFENNAIYNSAPGSVISHNVFTDVASHVIFESSQGDTIIEYNEVYNAPNVEHDAGVVYMGGNAVGFGGGVGTIGAHVRYNYAHQTKAKGFYADDCGIGKMIYNNICEDIYDGIYTNNGNYLTFADNVLYNSNIREGSNYYNYYQGRRVGKLTAKPSVFIEGTTAYNNRIELQNKFPYLVDWYENAELSVDNRLSDGYTDEGDTEKWMRKVKHNNIKNNTIYGGELMLAPDAAVERDAGEVDNNTVIVDVPQVVLPSGIGAIDVSVSGLEQKLYYPYNDAYVDGDVTFSWSKVFMCGEYKLVIARDSDLTDIVNEITTTFTTADVDLTEGTYYWTVIPVINAKTMDITAKEGNVQSFTVN